MTTILVVDDAELDQRLAGTCLERHGLRPIYDSNGLEALEVIAREKPDIVLTDLQMPKMDGLRLLQTLQNNPKTSGRKSANPGRTRSGAHQRQALAHFLKRAI